MSRVRARSLSIALAVSWTRFAMAQTCDPAVVELEERAAQALNLASQHEEALARFAAIEQRCHLPRTLARRAITEAALGRWRESDAHMREALASSDPWITERRAALQVESARIASHLGAIFITGAGPAGSVFVDGARVATWPMREPMRVQIGTLLVRVEADGCAPVERVVHIEAEGLAREEFTLTPQRAVTQPNDTQATDAVQPASPPRRPPANVSRPWVAVSITGLVLSVALVTASAVTTFLRMDATDELTTVGCYGATPDVARCDQIANRADGLATWSVAGFAVGGSLLALSAGAFIVSTVAPRRNERAFRCAPLIASPGAACGFMF